MTYGSYIENEQMYYTDRFLEADEQLAKYPHLRDVFGEVTWSKHRAIRKNPLLLELSHEYREGSQEAWLSSIERALSEVIPELTTTEVRDLKSELAGDTSNEVLAKVLELICFDYFDSKEFSVQPEPSLTTGGETDLRIDDQCPVYLEVTRLGIPATEASIEEVYESVAEELAAEIPTNKYLRLDIDTTKLVWNDQLNLSGSKAALLEQFHSAHLPTLLQHRDAIRLEDVQGMPDEWTLEEVIKDSVRYGRVPRFGSNWKGILNDSEYQAALRSPVSEFDGPITSAMIGEATGGLVELHSEMHSPSSAAKHQERIFLDRIEQKLNEKIDEGQREPDEANLLMISASHWLARSYTRSDRAPLGVEQQTKIRERIKSTLEDASVAELVGVVMIEDDLTNTIWIKNPGADPDILNDFGDTRVNDLLNS